MLTALGRKPTLIAPNTAEMPPHIKGLKREIQMLQLSVQCVQTKTKNTTVKDTKAELKLIAEREQVVEETSKGIAGNIAFKRDKNWKS